MSGVSDEQVAAIPGWFQDYDVDLFRLLLTATTERLGRGDLAELGAYLGKSAVLIGSHRRPGETFTVVDLFGAEPPSEENRAENTTEYPDLDRAAFERSYTSVLADLPVVVQDVSTAIRDHAAHGTHRFVHVDASHRYEHVRDDVDTARLLLKPDGVVVFDDFRSEHTPGVAAAVWRATAEGLRPFAVSPVKLYATFGDAAGWHDVIAAWATGSRWASETQRIAGRDVVRLWWEADSGRSGPTVGQARRALGRVRRLLASRGR